MRDGIHPDYKETVFLCACGGEIHARSIKPEFRLEICSNCHPFFTGKQKLIDSAGRVERFMKKYAEAAVATGKKPAKVKKKLESTAERARAAAAKAKPKKLAGDKDKKPGTDRDRKGSGKPAKDKK
jgi:large subunit ribosomal protein L31